MRQAYIAQSLSTHKSGQVKYMSLFSWGVLLHFTYFLPGGGPPTSKHILPPYPLTPLSRESLTWLAWLEGQTGAPLKPSPFKPLVASCPYIAHLPWPSAVGLKYIDSSSAPENCVLVTPKLFLFPKCLDFYIGSPSVPLLHIWALNQLRNKQKNKEENASTYSLQRW